jgi:hypothetical protein
MIRKAGTLIIIFGLSGGIFSSVCLGIASEEKISEQVAVVTKLPLAAVEITYWDIALQTDLPDNRLKIKASCALQNKGKTPMVRLDFDLLGAEKFYGVEVEIASIVRLIGGEGSVPGTDA